METIETIKSLVGKKVTVHLSYFPFLIVEGILRETTWDKANDKVGEGFSFTSERGQWFQVETSDQSFVFFFTEENIDMFNSDVELELIELEHN